MRIRFVAPLLALALAACATTGPQGGESLVLLGPEQQTRIGEQTAAKIGEQFEELDDRVVQDYVDEIGRRLAQHSRRDDIEFRFTVLDTAMVNAFAVPGGWIYVTTGLLELVETEAQLAGVIAHEIGHVTGRHSVRQLQTSYGAAIATTMLLDDQTMQRLAGLGSQLFLLEHSRDHELTADEYGIKYTIAAGYDPRGIVQFFEKLMEAKGERPGGLLTWFQTHPTTEKRIEEVEELLRTEYQPDYSQLRSYEERYQEKVARLD